MEDKAKIQFGFNARQHGNYNFSWEHEVASARNNGFSFLQLYCDDATNFERLTGQVEEILRAKFPLIVHAVVPVGKLLKALEEVSPALKLLSLDELIIHPKDSDVKDLTEAFIGELQLVRETYPNLTLFIENNSRLNKILHDPSDLKKVFGNVDGVQFLLDIAHMDDYEHIRRLIAVKYPAILHVADRNLANVHEHLPIGEGNIDFKKVFNEYLYGYEGRIIFEGIKLDDKLLESKKIISNILINE